MLFRLSVLFILVFCCIGIVTASAQCEGGCGSEKQGFCQSKNSCYCFAPYYGSHCEKDVTEHYESLVIALQVIFCIAFGLLGLFALSASILGFKSRKDALAPVINVRQVVLVAFTVQSFCEILVNAIHPTRDRSDETLGLFGHWFLTMMSLSLTLFAYVCVLFHWIDLVNLSLETLKKEHMLQKISVYYKGRDITLEDMVSRVRFLKKLKIPFGIFLAFLFVETLTFCILIEVEKNPELFNTLTASYFGLLCLFWIVLSVGFLVWGRRLVSIMPGDLTKKISKVTTRLTFLASWCVAWFALLLVLYAVLPPSQHAVIIRYVIGQWMTISISFGSIYCFVDKKLFGPVISGLTRSTSTDPHNETGTPNEVSMELEAVPQSQIEISS